MSGWARLVDALSAAMAVTLAVAGTAAAQSGPAPPLPEFAEIDQNGVDLTSGQFIINHPQVSVGGADGGLSRSYFGVGLRDNLVGTINIMPDNKAHVSLGASTIEFSVGSNYSFINTVSPETLTFNPTTQIYTFTTTDGTVASFDRALRHGNGPVEANEALITSLVGPDGETLTYTYTKWANSCPQGSSGSATTANCMRLQSVVSNLGYMVKYQYAGTLGQASAKALSRVTVRNLAHEYCDPAAESCATGSDWQTKDIVDARVNGSGTITETDTLNRQTIITFAGGEITQVQSPGGLTVSINRATTAGARRVTSVSSPAGTWYYSYELLNLFQPDASLRVRVRGPEDPAGGGRIITTDLYTDRAKSVTDELGRTTSYTINAATGRIVRVTKPEGDYVDLAYDARGNPTTVTRVAKPGSGLPSYVTVTEYPATCSNPKTCNKPMWVEERGGRPAGQQGPRTDFTYYATHGGVDDVTAPAGADGVRPKTWYKYEQKSAYYLNSSGGTPQAATPVWRLTTISSCMTEASCGGTADESKVNYAYGSTGVPNNLQVSSATARALIGGSTVEAKTSYTYDKFGNLVITDGPLSGTVDRTQNRYDLERRLIGSVGVDPDGVSTGRPALATRYFYRPDGQLDYKDLGTVPSLTNSGWEDFVLHSREIAAYDGAGRLTSSSLLAGGLIRSVVQYSYDVGGRPECTAVRMNPAAFQSLPSSACQLGPQGADGSDRISRATYDAVDRVVKVTEGYGTPDQRDAARTTFTQNGLIETVTDPNGSTTKFEYDGFDRLTKTRFPNPTNGAAASGTDYAEIVYDAVTGNVAQKRRRDGQIESFTYDLRRNLLSKSLPVMTTYEYDNFNRVKKTSAGGQSLSQVFDGLGRLVSSTGPIGTVGYSYNLAGQRTRMTWPDGFFVDYQRDHGGALIALRENGASSGLGVLATFTYDALGRRQELARGNGAPTTYGYDDASRLASLAQNLAGTAHDENLTFGYTPSNQLRSRVNTNSAYAFGGLQDVNRAYQVNGLNQLTTAGPLNLTYDGRGNLQSDGVTTYSYDGNNRLVSATGGTGLAYDPADRLYQVTSGGGAVTRFLYDGSDVIAEYDGANVLQRRFVHGPGANEPLVWYEGSGSTDRRWLTADEKGSVVAVTNASGAVLTINTYDEYGVPGASNLGRFQFTGHIRLHELDLYHFKARAYSATLGRFLQTDPIGYGDGLNIYAYAHGDPVNGRDPTGLEVEVGGVTVEGKSPSSGGGNGGGNNFNAAGFGSAPSGVTLATSRNSNPPYVGSPPPPVVPPPPAEDVTEVAELVVVAPPTPPAPPPPTVAEIVVTAHQTGTLAGVKINFNLKRPREQLWLIGADGVVVHIPTIAKMTKDSCGNTLGENRSDGTVAPPDGVHSVIHTHPTWAAGWPAAGDYTSAQRYDVYGIHPRGTWLLPRGSARGSAPTTLSGRTPKPPSAGTGRGCR